MLTRRYGQIDLGPPSERRKLPAPQFVYHILERTKQRREGERERDGNSICKNYVVMIHRFYWFQRIYAVSAVYSAWRNNLRLPYLHRASIHHVRESLEYLLPIHAVFITNVSFSPDFLTLWHLNFELTSYSPELFKESENHAQPALLAHYFLKRSFFSRNNPTHVY